MNPIDYMELLGALPDDLVDCAFSHQAKAAGSAVPQEHAPITVQVKTGTAIPLKKRGSVWAPRIVSGAAAAACLAVVCGMGILLRDDGMTMQTSTMETVVAPETDLPAATTAPAVTAAPQHSEVPAQTAQTAQTVQTTAALPAETTAQPAATEAPVAAAPAETTPAETTPAETTPAETTPAPAETAPAETAPAPAEPQTPVFELGDVDMDGKITFVDAALVKVDYMLALAGRLNESLITPEQRALGNVNGLDDGELLNAEKPYIEYINEETGKLAHRPDYDPFPLGLEDFCTIQTVAELRNWYGLDITVEEYLNHQEEDENFLSDYQHTHEIIRPDIEEAEDLLEKMGAALTGIFYEEPANYTITSELIKLTPTYDAEDFWRMAEEMMIYFKDAQ